LVADTPPVQTGAALEAEVVGHYLTAVELQQSALRGASMEVEIDANVPKLKRAGKLHALRNISKLGKVTYRMLGFNGDNSVKKDVIARYLSAEVQAQSGPNLAITPQNYKFKLKGLRDDKSRALYVLAVSPRKKEVGLFKGEIWLDRQTYMPVRESGRFVKSPSVFLGRMEFVRTYALQNGVAVPQRLESLVDTRLFGPVQLNIDFTNFSKDPEPSAESVASISEIQQ
jgi:hypothetical protein